MRKNLHGATSFSPSNSLRARAPICPDQMAEVGPPEVSLPSFVVPFEGQQNRYTNLNLGKWKKVKPGLKPPVPWWNFDPSGHKNPKISEANAHPAAARCRCTSAPPWTVSSHLPAMESYCDTTWATTNLSHFKGDSFGITLSLDLKKQ